MASQFNICGDCKQHIYYEITRQTPCLYCYYNGEMEDAPKEVSIGYINAMWENPAQKTQLINTINDPTNRHKVQTNGMRSDNAPLRNFYSELQMPLPPPPIHNFYSELQMPLPPPS